MLAMAAWQAKLMHNGIADLEAFSLPLQLEPMAACRSSLDVDCSSSYITSSVTLRASLLQLSSSRAAVVPL